MKFLTSQISYFINQNQIRRNISALLKYVLFLVVVIAVFAILFHVIMLYAEGRYFSWITGVYWTLTVMSTLGFGDITFESDLGRLFTIIVLITGMVLLLIMLPFAFIRFFYAPWIEAQIHVQVPREVEPHTQGHVIICRYDTIAPNLIKRLKGLKIPYIVLEPDSTAAVQLQSDGISVIQGELDLRETYEKLRVDRARMVFANTADTTNTNIVLTIREIAPDIPIVATAENVDSIDILELSGATNVLPLKQMLGENLANRTNAGGERMTVVRRFDDWQVVEFPVNNTILEGVKIRDTNVRDQTGVNIVGMWKRGSLTPAEPDKTLTDTCIVVAVGKKRQIARLKEMLDRTQAAPLPESVMVIGGGNVGFAAAESLKKKGVSVFIVDSNKDLRESLSQVADRVTIGDAADLNTIIRGGLREASLVILSTNDDAVNIYLSIYCRRLNPDLRIVSRITSEQNLEAIHRAGADFVLSYNTLGAESMISLIQGREPVILGEDVEFITLDLPSQLEGQTLAASKIGAITGLVVLAIRNGDNKNANPLPSTVLKKNCRLVVLGTSEQVAKFTETFE